MQRKVCRVCSIEKGVCEFSPDRSKKGGRSSECKSCAAARKRRARKVKALEAGLAPLPKDTSAGGKRWTAGRRARGDRRERLRMLKRHDRQTKLIQQGKRPRRRGPDWYEQLVEEIFGTEEEQIERIMREYELEDRIDQLKRKLGTPEEAEVVAELKQLKQQQELETAAEAARVARFDRNF